MEYYTLDDSLRRNEVIEGFESVIWTERYFAFGDFQIITKSTVSSRSQLAPETWITRKGSNYVAIVDTVTDDTADDGTRLITVTGKTLEALLDDRVAMPALTDTTTTPNWVLSGTPTVIANELFNAVCVRTVFDTHDSIPFYTFGTLLPTGSIPQPTDNITLTAAPDTLYNTLQKLCSTYNLGFRLVKDGDKGRIYFEIYTGNDLTTGQTVRKPVIFGPNMENLSKISYLSSTAPFKSVAYVFAQNGSRMVFAPGANLSGSGRDRRVLLVNSNNNGVAGPDLDAALQQEGMMALAAQRNIYSFDGQLPPNSPYIYGTDYNLGDVVEERNDLNQGNFMLITEQIFSSDNTGEHAYPTLTLVDTITPGSWNAWPGTQVWDDVDPSVHWDDL
ncbi:MAG TPA: hypothetical protein VGI71_23825 [Scandinavium sp.]|jgi:hypothetical protein